MTVDFPAAHCVLGRETSRIDTEDIVDIFSSLNNWQMTLSAVVFSSL